MVAEVVRPAWAEVHDLAHRYVLGMVQGSAQIQTLIKSLHLEEDDVISEGITAAFKDWNTYQPIYQGKKITPQTFIVQRANSGIFNFLRKSGSQHRAEQGRMGLSPRRDKARELCDWLKDVYDAAKQVYVDPKLNARRTFAMPQTIAIGSLMQREELSCRGCARLLASRDDLRAVLKLGDRVPHWRSLANARTIVVKVSGFHTAQEPA